jgi:hypothetical protein
VTFTLPDSEAWYATGAVTNVAEVDVIGTSRTVGDSASKPGRSDESPIGKNAVLAITGPEKATSSAAAADLSAIGGRRSTLRLEVIGFAPKRLARRTGARCERKAAE